MVLRIITLLVAAAAAAGAAETAASLSEQLRHITLDPDQCYRVRDLEFRREEIRFFFADGILIFTKPVAGQRIMAVYQAAEAGDDAEVLLRAPDRSERSSLSKAIDSPNLNEHFHSAILVLTDGGADQLLTQIREAGPKPRPDEGILLAGRMNEAVRNFAVSFQVRLVLDLLSGNLRRGLFYAALAGRTQGNFDLMFDPTLQEQIVVGRVVDNKPGGFEVWTNFSSRTRRAGAEEPATLDDYRIEATIQPDLTMNVNAKARITAQSKISGGLMFELAPQLSVTAVKLDGQPAEVFRRDSLRANMAGGRANDPFLVVLPAGLEPGSTHSIEFGYAGNLIRPAGNNVFYVAARTNWYPSFGFHFTTFDLTFRLPKELKVVATGEPVSESEEGPLRVARFRTSAPVRLAGFNIGDYESVTAESGGVKVRVCANRKLEAALVPKQEPRVLVVDPQIAARNPLRRSGEILSIPPPLPPPDPKARLRELAAEIVSAMEWMSGRFGPPPLPLVTVSPIPGNFGQGFPGLLYLSTLSYISEKDRPAAQQSSKLQTFYSEILHAHEIAHQWWGNLVTASTYRDEWLQEALANYSALMVLERKKGPKALETALSECRSELLLEAGEPKIAVEANGPLTWGSRLRADVGVDPWRIIIYDKGSWVLHMLRRRMGDTAFLSMLSETRERYHYRSLSTEDFRGVAARWLRKGDPDPGLVEFFDSWIYSTGIPTLEITTRLRGKAPALELVVTVKQSGVHDDFVADLPVEIRMSKTAAPIVYWLRTGPEPAVLTVKLKAPPVKVDVAPGAGVLAVRR